MMPIKFRGGTKSDVICSKRWKPTNPSGPENLGGSQAYNNVYKRIHVKKPKPGDDRVSKNHWLSRLDKGALAANAYNRPIVCLQNKNNVTFLPVTKPPGERPKDPIYLLYSDPDHWVLVNVKRGITPFPRPVVPRLYSSSPAGDWLVKIESSVALFRDLATHQG